MDIIRPAFLIPRVQLYQAIPVIDSGSNLSVGTLNIIMKMSPNLVVTISIRLSCSRDIRQGIFDGNTSPCYSQPVIPAHSTLNWKPVIDFMERHGRTREYKNKESRDNHYSAMTGS